MPSDIIQTVFFIAYLSLPFVLFWFLYKLFYLFSFIFINLIDRHNGTGCKNEDASQSSSTINDEYIMQDVLVRAGGRDIFGRTQSGSLE